MSQNHLDFYTRDTLITFCYNIGNLTVNSLENICDLSFQLLLVGFKSSTSFTSRKTGFRVALPPRGTKGQRSWTVHKTTFFFFNKERNKTGSFKMRGRFIWKVLIFLSV